MPHSLSTFFVLVFLVFLIFLIFLNFLSPTYMYARYYNNKINPFLMVFPSYKIFLETGIKTSMKMRENLQSG